MVHDEKGCPESHMTFRASFIIPLPYSKIRARMSDIRNHSE